MGRINAVLRNQKQSVLKKNIGAYKLEKRWEETAFAKKLRAQKLRAGLSDFQRHTAMVLRRRVSKAVRGWVNKNKSKVLATKKNNQYLRIIIIDLFHTYKWKISS